MDKKKKELIELINQFKENNDQYKLPTYKEARVRKDYIDRFFKLLGWDLDNQQGLSELHKEVIIEDSIEINGRMMAPDYAFRIGGKRKFFVEAKTPFERIKDSAKSAYQIREYAWNTPLPVSILTNFEEFAVFDCRVKPSEKDRADNSRIKYYTYEEYFEKFDEIYAIFSKDAVSQGSLTQFVQSLKKAKGTVEVDKDFLRQIEKWRELLAKNIALNNHILKYELNYAVQITIDRILFLRICEDRNIERYERLKNLTSEKNIYRILLDYFEKASKKYNSGIFDLENDELTPIIKIDDAILKKIILELYRPISPYNFNVIGVEILGNVYEQFLGKVISLTPSGKAKIELKPEVKKAGGIYYTPQYIVEYIVENTVGKMIKGKTPKQIEKIRILDPACGSGSFLIGAYAYLLKYHLQYYLKNKPKNYKKFIFQGEKNQWQITTDLKKKILLNNIFGVDIDQQAVEVTKLGLLLKILEKETKESVIYQSTLHNQGILPDLHKNIRCGNSLIGPEIYRNIQLNLTDESVDRRINVFDWNDKIKGFGEILHDGGFDIIIGNPPYIQIQKLKEFYPEETAFIQKYYETAQEKNVDIYVPFIEKSLSKLLKPNGVFGFINPNRFFNSEYGEKLRAFLKNYNIYHLVNFRHYFVFENSDSYTCLLFVQKQRQGRNLLYKEIRKLYDNDSEKMSSLLNEVKQSEANIIIDIIQPHFLYRNEWYFMTEDENKIFEKISKLEKFKEFYQEFFVGIQTSLDKVYILKFLEENNKEYHLFSLQLQKDFWLEKGIIKPIIDNTNIDFYYVVEPSKYVIFPYKIVDDNAILFTERELENLYKKTWYYLNLNKKILENREKGKFKDKAWYRFGRDQNIAKQHLSKMLIPHVVNQTHSAFDEKGEYCLDNVGANGILLKDEVKEHIYYFLAIMNSPIATFFISKISIFLSGGFYATNKQFAGEIPIKIIDFSNKFEKEAHEKIVDFVSDILELKKKLNNSKFSNDKGLYERQIDALHKQLNKILYELYGLKTEKEIAIIEESL